MKRKLELIRDSDADEAIELLLFIAVATVLGIRGFLGLTGYPQLGGGGLHIAHMLWGGLFMFVAIVLLLVFWNPAMRRVAAVVAGVGFGFFVDELGKFITSDNDYFYRPTVAILYLMFLALWGFARWLRSGRPLNPEELRVNEQLRSMLSVPEAGAGRYTHAYFTATRGLEANYLRIVRRRWFGRVLTAWFLLVALYNLVEVMSLIAEARGRSFGVWFVQAGATGLEALFVWAGWMRFRRSRIAAYRWFQRSIAVSLLVIQVGHFYANQFWALNGVVLNVLLYLALTAMIEEERARLAPKPAAPATPPAPTPATLPVVPPPPD